jgi:Dolichyl-phosphate-mannose-protein mannosyltransferase
MTTAAATHTAVSSRAPARLQLATIAAFAVVALFIGMRLWRLTDFALDGDEIFSVQLARDSWPVLFAEAVKDAIHPPLLYVLLKLWIAVGGESLLWLRLFPVTASVLCLLPAFALCRDLNISAAARNLAIGIVAVHPYAMYNSQHVRMYALLMLAALLSAWRFERYLDRASVRNLVLLGAANAFLGYTQYYGWSVVLLEFVYLLWLRRNPIAFLVSTLPAVILFSPWVWYAGQVLHSRGLAQNLGWIGRPTFGDLNWFWVDLTGFAEFPSIGVRGAIALLILFALAYRRYGEPRVHWLMLLWIAPAPLAFVISQWLPQSIWGHRHLLFAIWPFALLFADSVWRMPRWVTYPVLAATAIWAVYAIQFHAADHRKLPWDVLTMNMLDADQSQAGNQSSAPHVPVYTIDPYLHYPIGFDLDCLRTGHLGPLGPRVASRPDTAKLPLKAARFEAIKTDSVGQIPINHGAYFWVGWTDSSWHEQLTPPEMLEQRGCQGGPEISQADSYHRVWLAPIQCQ